MRQPVSGLRPRPLILNVVVSWTVRRPTLISGHPLSRRSRLLTRLPLTFFAAGSCRRLRVTWCQGAPIWLILIKMLAVSVVPRVRLFKLQLEGVIRFIRFAFLFLKKMSRLGYGHLRFPFSPKLRWRLARRFTFWFRLIPFVTGRGFSWERGSVVLWCLPVTVTKFGVKSFLWSPLTFRLRGPT